MTISLALPAGGDDLLPPGTQVIDTADPHYRYLWTAQYDDLDTGPWISQLDDQGMARSAGLLDCHRLVRLSFIPQWTGLPPIEVRAQRVLGEVIKTFWTVDRPLDPRPPHIAVMIVLERDGVPFYVALDEDGGIRLGTKANW